MGSMESMGFGSQMADETERPVLQNVQSQRSMRRIRGSVVPISARGNSGNPRVSSLVCRRWVVLELVSIERSESRLAQPGAAHLVFRPSLS